jgi:hypothetical protein
MLLRGGLSIGIGSARLAKNMMLSRPAMMRTISLLHISCGLRGGVSANFEPNFGTAPLSGVYLAKERAAEPLSWGSYTYELTLNADGSAQFYSEKVADRDTDDTYTYFGQWSYKNGIVDFKANSKRGKSNYADEQVFFKLYLGSFS